MAMIRLGRAYQASTVLSQSLQRQVPVHGKAAYASVGPSSSAPSAQSGPGWGRVALFVG